MGKRHNMAQLPVLSWFYFIMVFLYCAYRGNCKICVPFPFGGGWGNMGAGEGWGGGGGVPPPLCLVKPFSQFDSVWNCTLPLSFIQMNSFVFSKRFLKFDGFPLWCIPIVFLLPSINDWWSFMVLCLLKPFSKLFPIWQCLKWYPSPLFNLDGFLSVQ